MRRLLKFFKVLFLLLVIVTGSAAALLKYGIRLNSLGTEEMQLNGLTLVWKEKLELQIDSLAIASTVSGDRYTGPRLQLETLTRLSRLFSKITIDSIRYNQFTAQLSYSEKPREQSFFNLKSDNIHLLSTLIFHDLGMTIDVTECTYTPYSSKAAGRIQVEFDTMTASGELEANIADSLPVQLSFQADTKGISFQGRETGTITTIKPVVDLFELDPDIQPWITESLTGDRYRLTSFTGSFPWKRPIKLLDTLSAEIRIDNCAYVFEEGFEPIRTQYTDVVFEKGVLIIKPNQSTFYGQRGERSWLDINFNNPDDIILTAYILTHAVLNDDILRLLQAYDIELPFKQVQGNTETDLTLTIHLNDEMVEATGTFSVAESRIQYENDLVSLANAFISLRDSEVTIDRADVGFQNSLQAHLSGVYDGETARATLLLEIENLYFDIDGTTITLQDGAPKPKITITLTPDGDRYAISPTNVTVADMDFLVESFGGPFLVDDFSVGIPPTLVISPQNIRAEVSGSFSIKRQSADLLCTLLQFSVNDFQLTGVKRLPLAIQYKEQLTIRALDKSQWIHGSTPIEVAPTTLHYNGESLSITSPLVHYGDIFSAVFSANYDFASRQGDLFFNETEIFQQPLGDLHGQIIERPQSRFINFAEIGVLIDLQYAQQNSFTVTIPDLAPLHERSPLLQRFKISAGNLSVGSKRDGHGYTLSGSFHSPAQLFFRENTAIEEFVIEGDCTDGKLFITFNDSILLQYKESELKLIADRIGFNVAEIVNMLTEEDENDDDESFLSAIKLTLYSRDGFLYLTPLHRALADTIHFKYDDSTSLLDLRHAQGHVTMRSDGYTFTLEGKNLDDKFIGALLQNSTFKGGKMNLVALGEFNNFSALVKIRDTLLKDHQAFNNVMGFLNTVPALVTFSLPEYNTKGVHLTSVIAGALVKDSVATIESLEVKSPLFDLTGTGWADFSRKVVDMDINLISRAKTNIRKIPLIGYIIAGEEKRPSVTLEITGDLDDPKVTNTMFKEVATMPFSMLYRTLRLPVDLVEKLGE